MRVILRLLAVPVIVAFACSTLAPATEYFLSPDGDDNGPGTMHKPWRSLEKANRSLQPGDAAILLEGEYTGVIRPLRGGRSPQAPVVYRSRNRRGAVLRGENDTPVVVDLKEKRFVEIEGFRILPTRGGFGRMEQCEHVAIRDCHMEGSTRVYCPLVFDRCHHVALQGNTLARHLNLADGMRIHGDMCQMVDCQNLLVEGNDFSKIGHCPLRIWRNAAFVVIRGNVFHNGWGRNFELFNVRRCLFEENVITDAFDGAGSADPDAKVFLVDGIFRRNLVCDNWDSPLCSNSYHQEGETWLDLNRTRIYQNVFANNLTQVWRISSHDPPNARRHIFGNVMANNVFYHNDYEGDFDTATMANRTGEGFTFLSNLFCGDRPGESGVRISDASLSRCLGGNRFSGDALNHQMPDRSRGNVDAEPGFVSFADRCFALRPESPCVDAGAPLTHAVDNGQGTTLRVGDARWFFDGFAVEGQQGDLVMIGRSRQLARVVRAEVERDLLHLDRDLAWKKDDPVSLPYAGSAPDLGAEELGDGGVLAVVPRAEPALAAPGRPVRFSALITGATGDVTLKWDFGDGTAGEGLQATHAYNGPGDYCVRLRCSDRSGAAKSRAFLVRVAAAASADEPLLVVDFEKDSAEQWAYLWNCTRKRNTGFERVPRDSGGHCLRIYATDDRSILSCDVKPKGWQLDRHPVVRFDYCIAPGTPVGVWLSTWASDRYGSGRIGVGGTPVHLARRKGESAAVELVDDGAWHAATIDARLIREVVPGARVLYSFEFYTEGDARRGQEFRFDNFTVLPEGKPRP